MKLSSSIITTVLFCTMLVNSAMAQTAPAWGNAQSFAILSRFNIFNTGATVITGNIGGGAGYNVTGFPPGILSGLIYKGDASIEVPAMVSAIAVYTNLMAQTSPTTTDLTGKILGTTAGATTLNPGIYKLNAGITVTGTLTLNDGGDPNAVFIFQGSNTFFVSPSAKVVMSSGGKGNNVFWLTNGQVDIAIRATFCGNILAAGGVTIQGNATTITGKIISIGGSVTVGNGSNTTTIGGGDLIGKPVIVDTDGDGIADNLDDYPNDATKAFNNYSSTGAGSTVAFEDQWPSKGDFDMNDLVMAYKYNVITNAKNVVVQVIGNYTLMATGGNSTNGFSVQFPIPSASVSGLTGATLEAGQDKAVIVLFPYMRGEMPTWNTQPGVAKTTPKTYTVTFNVTNGPTLATFGTDYNPFIVNVLGTSRREVHLPGKLPTQLADMTLFGTKDDGSNTTTGLYYVTKTGLPFAISVPTATFSYPIEGTDITQAYTNFAAWAISGGTTNTNWYDGLVAGNTVPGAIYVN
jgi:LruC domain-containing protein